MKGFSKNVALQMLTFFIVGLIGSIIFILDIVMGQELPSGFPSPEPEQTPIDGELGILAALGGAYAKKS